MADIKNKNELKRRIELFLHELDYSINEKFCKETMRMMREFIGHASHQLDCKNSKIESLNKKLKEYRQLEKQGLLLRLPCKVGDKVYLIREVCDLKGTKIVDEFVVYSFDLRKLQQFVVDYDGHRLNIANFGRTAFLTREEAEQVLAEMKGV